MILRCLKGALLLTLALVGLVMVLTISEPADATIIGDAPPLTGDWIVNSDTVVTG